jgi:signal peptidase II
LNLALLFSSILVLDQATKYLVRNTMAIGQTVPVLGQFLRITYVENSGIAFGLRITHGAAFTVLSALASLFIIVLLFTHKNEKTAFKASLAVILAGAVGNLIDRICYHHVADFIDIGIRNLRWYIFNVADSAVVVGMIILSYLIFVSDLKTGKKPVSA